MIVTRPWQCALLAGVQTIRYAAVRPLRPFPFLIYLFTLGALMSFKIDEDAIRTLARLLDETKLTEIEITNDDQQSLRVQRAAAPVAAMPAMQAAPIAGSIAPVVAAMAKAEDHPGAVKSPMVGTVYMQAAPGNPPFIDIGKTVKKGDTLLIVEAMKVMNPIKSPASGTITQIMVADGKPVEFGETLVVIE